MSNDSPIAANASRLTGLSPEAVASARQSYLTAGFSKEQVDAAFSAQPAAGPKIVGHTSVAGSRADASLSQEQLEAGFKALLERGTIDRDTVLRAAANSGITFNEAPSVQAQTEIAIDKTFAPPAAPHEYQIDLPSNARNEPTEKIARFMSDLKSGFHAAGVPSAMANPMAQSFFDATKAFPKDASEAATKLYLAEQGARVRKLSADYQETARLADIGQKALGKIGEQFYATGSFYTAEAFMQLANFGRIIETKAKRAT